MKLFSNLALVFCSLLRRLADEKGREEERHEKEKHAAKFPFFPSLLSTAHGRAVTSAEFEDPGVCMGCHPTIYKQWNGSMHSNAFFDPVFQALWRIGVKETNGGVEKLCAGCHTAIGTVAGEVKLGPDGVFQASEIAKKGVQCDLCHTIKGARDQETPTREPENGSIIVDPGSVKRGPYKDADSPITTPSTPTCTPGASSARTAITFSTPRTTSRSRTPIASGRPQSTPRPASSARTAT